MDIFLLLCKSKFIAKAPVKCTESLFSICIVHKNIKLPSQLGYFTKIDQIFPDHPNCLNGQIHAENLPQEISVGSGCSVVVLKIRIL